MPVDPRTPVLIGAGQLTNRPKSESRIKSPMALMTEASRLALEDAKATPSDITAISVVNIISWTYPDAPGLLAEELGATPRESVYTPVGGNTPQWLVNRAAEQIANGETDLVLIAGAESFASAQAARNMGRKLDRGDRRARPAMIGEEKVGTSPAEMAVGLVAPSQIYPILENAYRASKGRTVVEHQEILGRLCESFNKVAAENPYSWFPQPRSAEEIATPSLENRMVAFPYPKYMNSVMRVDQAAALVLASAETAERLGSEDWVFPLAGGELNDGWFFSERPEIHESPAIEALGRAVAREAGVEIDEIEYVDLYSCFPVAVEVAADALGLPADGSRTLTLTGGLPYFGGPGNNYASHSIAEAVRRLRENPDSFALCSALGWYITKHAIGIYGGSPPDAYRRVDMSDAQKKIDSAQLTSGGSPGDAGFVRSHTVLYDREGKPTGVPVIFESDDRKRLVAIAPIELADEASGDDFIGMRGRLGEPSGGRPVFLPE